VYDGGLAVDCRDRPDRATAIISDSTLDRKLKELTWKGGGLDGITQEWVVARLQVIKPRLAIFTSGLDIFGLEE
jgi:hypothetical protein